MARLTMIEKVSRGIFMVTWGGLLMLYVDRHGFKVRQGSEQAWGRSENRDVSVFSRLYDEGIQSPLNELILVHRSYSCSSVENPNVAWCREFNGAVMASTPSIKGMRLIEEAPDDLQVNAMFANLAS